MVPDFGVGLPRFIFELENDEDIYDELMDRIREQVSIYLPVIKINNLSMESYPDEAYVNVKLDYAIDFLEIKDSLDLILNEYWAF